MGLHEVSRDFANRAASYSGKLLYGSVDQNRLPFDAAVAIEDCAFFDAVPVRVYELARWGIETLAIEGIEPDQQPGGRRLREKR